MVLEDYGPLLVTASTGEEAIKALDSNRHIELVLMDIMMPEKDGIETIKAIRQHKVYRNIPIIALTAKVMKSELEKCLEAGASDYLSKPIAVDLLLQAMEIWLNKEAN